jgi:hypothetical protein
MFVFVVRINGLRLCLCTAACLYGYGEPRWNDIDRGNQVTQRKTCPSANLSTTNPI